MPRKSSKTAHVLNLLTTGSANDEPTADTEQQEEDISVAKLVQKQPVTKKSQQRKSTAAKAEPQAAAPQPAETGSTPAEQTLSFTAQPDPEPVPTVEPPIVPEPAALPEPAVQTAQPSTSPNPTPPSTIPNNDDVYELVNVAELAIKEKVSSVIERMNLCKCVKCRQDVIAFALNHLPARYLPQSRAGSIDIDRYLAEYGREVTAALVKSCIKVKANPRH